METGISAVLHLVGQFLPDQVPWFTLGAVAVAMLAILTGVMQRLILWIELGRDWY